MLPQKPSDAPVVRPERPVSSEQLEAVIRRAVELQEGRKDAAEGLSETELFRIGTELGLSRAHLQQALAEVRGDAAREKGVLASVFGPAYTTASRTLPGDAEEISKRIERHLCDTEYMVVSRRFPDRTCYTRGTGLAAVVGRAASQFSGVRAPLKVPNLEVSVQSLEDGFCHVTLGVVLTNERIAAAVGSSVGGGMGGGAAAISLGIIVAPPAALVGLPIAAAVVYGARLVYRHDAEQKKQQLESFLDRLQYGEVGGPRESRRRLGTPPPRR